MSLVTELLKIVDEPTTLEILSTENPRRKPRISIECLSEIVNEFGIIVQYSDDDVYVLQTDTLKLKRNK